MKRLVQTRLIYIALVAACILAVTPAYAQGPNPPPGTEVPTAVSVQTARVRPLSDLSLSWLLALLAASIGVAGTLLVRQRRVVRANAYQAAAPRAIRTARAAVAAPRGGPRRPYSAPAIVQRAALETHAGSPILGPLPGMDDVPGPSDTSDLP